MARKKVAVHLDGKEYKAEDGATSRAEGHAAGLAAKSGQIRNQSAEVNAGASNSHAERKGKKGSDGRSVKLGAVNLR